MSYTPTIWSSGDIITSTKISNLETQYREAIKLTAITRFGAGDMGAYISVTAYPTGAGFDKLHPNTSVFRTDPVDLVGTSQLEVTMKATNVVGLGSMAIFDLTGAPDTALTNSTVTGTGSTTGERLRSGNITMPASGTVRNLGLKSKISNSAHGIAIWNPQLIRTA